VCVTHDCSICAQPDLPRAQQAELACDPGQTRRRHQPENLPLADGLGSTIKLVDGAGAVVGDYRYDVFGPLMAHTGASTEFSYTGEQNDPNGLEYLRARYYEPGTGRFLSRDPLGGGYPYAGGNPVNMLDPTGLYKVCGISDHPDFMGQLFCLDSTELGGPLCDPSTGVCEFYVAETSTEGSIIPLSDRFGDACVLQDARIRHCTRPQTAEYHPSEAIRAAIWSEELAFLNSLSGTGFARELALAHAARMNSCLHRGGPVCGFPLEDVLRCVDFGFCGPDLSPSCGVGLIGLAWSALTRDPVAAGIGVVGSVLCLTGH
jgi:RHS repeat-associated protein